MARIIKAKLLMKLREQGQSRRSIAKTRHMSMESVCEMFDIAAERGVARADVKDAPEDEVYRLFYPIRRVRESAFDEPDWDYVHKEMAKVGVNPRLLHDEYKADCARWHLVAMGYTRFCERYGDHVPRTTSPSASSTRPACRARPTGPAPPSARGSWTPRPARCRGYTCSN